MAEQNEWWLRKKLVDPKDLPKLVQHLRQEGSTIATLNGSFDLLHAGHLYIISQAKLQADVLLILLNSDRSIKTYKGENRPIVPLTYRLELIAALEFVDYVSWFEEKDPCRVLDIIRPDVHVNGMEYGKECIEASTLASFGAKLHLVDRIPSLSTSNIIGKIQECVT